MTNLEAIQAKIGMNYPIDSHTFEVALIESGIDPTADFEGGKPFDWAMVKILVSLIGSAERISEGGYTVELNLDALWKLLSWYLSIWGWRNPLEPRLKDGSCKW